jgi:hypothetical protein
MAWLASIGGFFKSLRGARAKQLPPSRVRSGERIRRVSDAEMVVCLFCGRTASLRAFEVKVQLDCSTCGACEVTPEAMRLLRADENLRTAVLRQVRRHLENGAERPLVDLDFIKSLRRR